VELFVAGGAVVVLDVVARLLEGEPKQEGREEEEEGQHANNLYYANLRICCYI